MDKNKLKNFYAILNLIGFIAMITVNVLANSLPINGKMTGEISNKYPNLFTPAGFTFTIWGVIYFLLAVFIIYQFLLSFQENSNKNYFINKINIFFFLSSISNLCWILSWHFEVIWLSLLFMFMLLTFLIFIYLKLGIGISNTLQKEKYFIHIPFSIYLGWISIATIANTIVFLKSLECLFISSNEVLLTIIAIAAGIILAFGMLYYRKDIFYPIIIIWALFGIFYKRLTYDSKPFYGIIIISGAGILFIIFGIIMQVIRRKVY